MIELSYNQNKIALPNIAMIEERENVKNYISLINNKLEILIFILIN